MKFLYKYPHSAFPYDDLIKENARRGKEDKEYNMVDTGIFDDDRYWDIFIETAKEADDPDELLFRVIAYNRGDKPAPLHIIPQVWFRNTWAWGHETADKKPQIRQVGPATAQSKHYKLGERFVECSPSPGFGASGDDVQPKMLFTDNDTAFESLGWGKNKTPFVKDGFHRHICDGEKGAVNPEGNGTKMAAWYAFM